MHWPDYDGTTWGLILAIALFLFTIPLNILTNLLTPIIKNWWARRSLASLQEQVAILEKEIHRINAIPQMTEYEEMVATGLLVTATIASLVGLIYIWTTGLNMGWLMAAKIRTPEQVDLWFLSTLTIFTFIQLYLLQYQFRYQKQMKDRSPSRRRSLEKNLADLKARFDHMNVRHKATQLV